VVGCRCNIAILLIEGVLSAMLATVVVEVVN
jgi:hypothetical protein